MIKKIIRNDIATVEQLLWAIKQTCIDNPNKIVTASSTLNTVRIYIYSQQPRTDSHDTIETFQEDGGFWKNGKIIKPSKTWFDKYNSCPVSR